MSFGAFIRECRETRCLPMKTLADGIGVSVAYWSDMERGHRAPLAFEHFPQLAEMLDMRLGTLIDAALSDRKDWGRVPLPDHVLGLVRDIIAESDKLKPGQVAAARDILGLVK